MALARTRRKRSTTLARLSKEQARFLTRIEREQAELASEEALVREVAEAIRGKIEPLLERLKGVMAEIREVLLATLLSPQSTKHKRMAAEQAFVDLFGERPSLDGLDDEDDFDKEDGLDDDDDLDDLAEDDDEDDLDDLAEDDDEDDLGELPSFDDDEANDLDGLDDDDDLDDGASDEPAAEPTDERVEHEGSGLDAEPMAASGTAGGGVAEPRGAEDQRSELRVVFRRLASANHPDHATDGPERQRRTTLMKELTLAYESGDLARLLRLERNHRRGGATSPARSEALHIKELRASVRQLRAQLAEIRSQRAEVTQERSELPSFRRTQTGTVEVTDPMEKELETEISRLMTIRDFSARFRDGKLTLKAFSAGPFAQKQNTKPERGA